MSATLDSDLLAQYFGNCQALAAGGRTHPVEQLFLEDVFEFTEYHLDAEGPAALRVRAGSSSKTKALQKASTSKQKLVQVAGFLQTAANPHALGFAVLYYVHLTLAGKLCLVCLCHDIPVVFCWRRQWAHL